MMKVIFMLTLTKTIIGVMIKVISTLKQKVYNGK